jgi:hypothetical protein
MASEIIHSTIDAAYPVAGQDNDTQGFRDNFQIIKDGLSTANSEITALQRDTAKLNESNDFNGTNISDANLILTTEQYHNIGTVINNQNISFLNGHYQVLTINPADNDITLTLSDWPERDGLAKLTVQINTLSKDPDPEETHTITWLAENGGTIRVNSSFPNPFNLNTGVYDVATGGPAIVEFWTYNSGNTVFANWLGRFDEL